MTNAEKFREEFGLYASELWAMPEGAFVEWLNSQAQPEHNTEKALRLLAEWAIECDFGYDNIPEEYEKYKDEIKDMGYTEGLIYIAKMECVEEDNAR